ncbi:MAG: ribonuclease H-like domain-containing protein, partial [Candidatus Aminicenantes bacterium]|nr:ribonuclease H-like domain-containing protein [Candidatus Aminicenantes bacterium]
MALEDKLKHLRRERQARTRARSVESAWEKLGEEAGLSVKQKLERLIALTDKGRGMAARTPERPAAARRREPVQVFENAYQLGASYGRIPIAMGLQIPPSILGFLSRERAFEGLDLSSALFLDLETTGLSGGAGTVPFLVGLAHYQDERFKVVQFFLDEMGEEAELIRQLDGFVRDMGFRSLVTYNGKAYDLPLVETRFALHRTSCPLRDLPHFDFLFSARSLWKHKHENCTLFNLAQQVVQAGRTEDIPGG